ncbi:MAG: DNRLRE domain-containing protein [Actinobacteria bacterium]|nr:DNRLRE domain-containing protein [Actinomycetota bacterium]
MARHRSLVALLAATLITGLLALIPATPTALAAANKTTPRLVRQTETTDVYANADGSRTAVFYAGPANFFDKTTNQWRKLDKEFRRVGDHLENGAGPVRVQLPSDTSAGKVTVAKDDWSASFALEDAKPNRPGNVTKGQVRYDDVAAAAGVSLDYRMLSNGLKEDIVLDQSLPAGSPDHFRFRLSVAGATPAAVDGGTAIALQDGAGHELARIPRGMMVDAKGAKGVVDMHLVEQGASWFVDVAPDPAFLRGDRAYPVRIDPSIIYTATAPTDSFTDSVCTTCNYNGMATLKAGWANGMPGTTEYYSYIRFPDLTPIVGKWVANAQLRLEATYQVDPSSYGVTALRTHQSWNASTITWSNMANHGPESSHAAAGGYPDYYFDVTSWAQGWAGGQDGEWINGKWSPYGATINTAGAAAYYQLGAAESTFVPNIPSLSVTYTNQSPNLPTALSPADGWTGTSTPQLSATLSDPDDSNGWIEFDLDSANTAIVPTVNGIASFTPTLGAGTHSWRARGRDFDSAGPWTALRYFTVNTAPAMPDQLSPADGYYSTTLPALSARYVDVDNNSGSLAFEVDGVAHSVTGIANGATGSCTTANLCLPSSLAPGLHSWRVQAVDGLGLPSTWSPYQQFEYHYAGQVVREEFPVNGSQWDTTKWAISSGLTVSNNQGVFPASTASKRATATAAYLQDSEVSFTYSIPDRTAGTELRTTLRGYGATGSAQLPNGYRLDIPSGLNQDGSTTISLKKLVNGVVTPLGSSFNYTGSGYVNTRVRFRVDGSTISVKVWPAGTLEPTAWSAQRTDSSITAAGTLQIAQSWQTGSGRVINVDNVTYENRSFWGVDSSKPINQARLDVLNTQYGGRPNVWGRYLTTQKLDRQTYETTYCPRCGLNEEPPGDEITFAQNNKIAIQVIQRANNGDILLGEQLGRDYANLAQEHAQRLGIPTSVAIFMNIEECANSCRVDAGFIWGWFDQLDRVYGRKVGYYANTTTIPSRSEFATQFCAANADHARVGSDSFIYASVPFTGRTKESEAPPYAASNLDCGVVSSTAWQYGLAGQDRASGSTLTDHPQAKSDPTQGPSDFDTDLIKPELTDVLWYPGGVSCPAPRGAYCI